MLTRAPRGYWVCENIVAIGQPFLETRPGRIRTDLAIRAAAERPTRMPPAPTLDPRPRRLTVSRTGPKRFDLRDNSPTGHSSQGAGRAGRSSTVWSAAAAAI